VTRVLVTGAGGFLGYHVSRRLLEGGGQVVGVDNLNAYYDPKLKRARRRFVPMQPGDVESTHAESGEFEKAMGFRPATPLAVGVGRFAEWFREWDAGECETHRLPGTGPQIGKPVSPQTERAAS
jgi:nucleoside-diphosphate-sugar epimerase